MTKAAAIMSKLERVYARRALLEKAVPAAIRSTKATTPEQIAAITRSIKARAGTGILRADLIAQIRKQQVPFKASPVEMWQHGIPTARPVPGHLDKVIE